jgi:Cys-rich protein (TIGR01571 family)
MYQLLEKRKWATSLCHCDPESCILAHVLPCHIYAKIYDNPENSCYLFNFIYYGIFGLAMYNVYYWLNYINKNRCPSLETDYCFGLNENCSQYYMLVNGIPSRCVYNDSICVHSETDCFVNYTTINMYLSMLGSFSYFVMILLKFFLRDRVKKDYNIESNFAQDVCAITLFSSCGLAQELREVEMKNTYLV